MTHLLNHQARSYMFIYCGFINMKLFNGSTPWGTLMEHLKGNNTIVTQTVNHWMLRTVLMFGFCFIFIQKDIDWKHVGNIVWKKPSLTYLMPIVSFHTPWKLLLLLLYCTIYKILTFCALITPYWYIFEIIWRKIQNTFLAYCSASFCLQKLLLSRTYISWKYENIKIHLKGTLILLWFFTWLLCKDVFSIT